jgi:hypothetical protein
LASLALSGALAMSMRRYFPTFYSSVSLGKIVLDFALLTIGLSFGLMYGSNNIS